MIMSTRRFVLRDFRERDRAAFLAYQADPLFLAHHGPRERLASHAERLFATFQAWAVERPRVNFQLAVTKREAERVVIGCCGLRRAHGGARHAELGIELSSSAWGRYGYAVEIGRALIDFGFGHLGLEAISGQVVSANERAKRLAAWFGAREVKSDPGPEWMRSRGWREVTWQLTRDTWERQAGERRS